MSSVVLTGSTSGSVTVQAAAVAGSNTATIGAATGTHYPFTAGTAVASTSGTSIDFTSIPSWVKRVTVIFNGVSTNGSSNIQIQLGDAGGIENTGYLGASSVITSVVSTAAFTAGFGVYHNSGASAVTVGSMTISNISGNAWVASGAFANTDAGRTVTTSGAKTLSDVLTQIRVTTANGTDAFDAGSINILYE
jgi:hypothetical protein